MPARKFRKYVCVGRHADGSEGDSKRSAEITKVEEVVWTNEKATAEAELNVA